MPGNQTYNFRIEGGANVAHFRRQMKKRVTPTSQRRAMEELDYIFGWGPKPSWYKEPKGPPSYAD